MTRRALALVVAALVTLLAPAAWAKPIRLWHAYRGDEEKALEAVVATWKGEPVELLSVPYDAFLSKIGSAVPLGEGPDLFVDAHNRLGEYRARHVIDPVGDALEADAAFDPKALEAVRDPGATQPTWAVPLSEKSLALFVNPRLVDRVPETIEELGAVRVPYGGYAIAWATQDVYVHAPFLHAFGGRLLTSDDQLGFVGEGPARSLDFVRELIARHAVPEDADGALVTTLFKSGKAATAISGPWLIGDLVEAKVPFRVVPLPEVGATGEPLRPLLTVEALMLTPAGAARADVRALARLVASADAARTRARLARTLTARADVATPDDPVLAAFAEQAKVAIPMPSSRAMNSVWDPAKRAIRKALTGEMPARDALDEAKRRFDDVRRPLPPRASPAPLAILLGLCALAGALVLLRRARRDTWPAIRRSLPAYKYVAHAVVVVGLLVVVPLAIGAGTAFFAGREEQLRYVGLANFREILTARGGPLLASGSFYLVLAVTILWTVLNVALHVVIGVALALLLSRPAMRLRALYRVLLIVPWAVPSYVTALMWKGMFHRQYGAVTALILSLDRLLGLHVEPISWFSRFSTAFAANVTTNVWLGFPFMMVVTMGALTGVPDDVLEAAAVDGATRWQRLTRVTLPMIAPTLAPAVTLGAIWTFNMFNVVYLVSGGDPDGKTDILVSEAYRWAFTREAQYGYAAAYAVLIFFLLTGFTRLDAWRKRVRDLSTSAPVVAGDAAVHAKGAL